MLMRGVGGIDPTCEAWTLNREEDRNNDTMRRLEHEEYGEE
jgi:hypothetical protein